MRFVTLYPEGSNIELIKDVGQIPYFLMRYHNVKSTCVFFNINPQGINTQYIKGMKTEKIPLLFKNRMGIFLSKVIYLLRKAKKVDWLNLYHLDRENGYLIDIYKFLNPRGHVYLKLDLDLKGCRIYQKNIKWRKTLQYVISKADLVTVETQKVKDEIQQYVHKDIKVLQDGFRDVPIKKNICYHKSNLFVTAARLGSKQKDTATLLKGFAMSSQKHDWNLKLIGPCTADFIKYKNNFLKENPALKNRIIFAGQINDRKTLYEEFAKAKVFVLDSKWESFGLVLPEALNQGCRIIVSDQVPPAKEITNNGKYGDIIKSNDIQALSNALIEATQSNSYTSKDINERIDYAKRNFEWENICDKLYKYLLQS